MQSVDPNAEKKTAIVPDKVFTLAELKQFDGSDLDDPIYVGIKGVVYDMTTARNFYGKDKAYNIFTGRDASRNLAKMDLKGQDSHVNDLTVEEKQCLDQWETKLASKYPAVGRYEWAGYAN
jgi:predicted heme/steroid binding protein